jgi:hypothetical protein
MEMVTSGVMTSMNTTSGELLSRQASDVISGEPLHIELPTQGLRYQFSKLYANQSEEDAWFSLRYVDRNAGFAGYWIALLSVLVLWTGIILTGMKRSGGKWQVTQPVSLGLVAVGAVTLAVSILLLGASVTPPAVLSLVIAAGLAIRQLYKKPL